MPVSSGFARGNGASCAAADELKTPAATNAQIPDLVILVLPARCLPCGVSSFVLRSSVTAPLGAVDSVPLFQKAVILSMGQRVRLLARTTFVWCGAQ